MSTRLTKHTLPFAALAIAGAFALSACANNPGSQAADGEDFPNADIRLVVPWSPGGQGDLTARTLAPLLEDSLGVSVIVENRPGANGSIGYSWLAEQEPNGYNLSMMGVEVATLQFMNYDVDPDDFAPIGQAIEGPGAIAVPVNSPYESLTELIEDARNNPGDVTYSSPGVGSVWDSPARGLQDMTGVTLTSVPFDGSSPAIAAAAAGDVDFSIDAMGSQKAQVDGDEMRYLAMLSEERHPDYPDVPTAAEEGVDLQNASWAGIMAPAGTPEEIVKVLSDAMESAVADPGYVETIENGNQIPTFRNYEETAELIQSEAERYGPWIEMAQQDQ
ncbi:MAG: tripartite tricarboxylate transporter substrate binding protein [Micrococcaceae bacterium]